MPSRRGLRQIVGISPNAELIIMVSLGMVRNIMDWFSFTWNENVQKIWNLPGPEPSFSAKYHFDYWIKNVLSLVVLFRNFTTHLHLLFYIIMLYPVLTGEQPRLILPWLYLQMMKNIVTDVICTIAGVLLCWVLHSCGLLLLEFLVVQIISMIPSIYLWRRLRSYYFDLYYAELDDEFSFPVIKAMQGSTLAQRRRATKSLDGTVPTLEYSENRSRVNSCLTYDEFFGPANWEGDTDNKLSKSLTTLLTIESQDSDDVEEDSCLKIIDDENLTPAEKTLKILGLTREEVDANVLHIHKRTSTTDLAESGTGSLQTSIDADVESSFFSLTGETVQSRAVGIQVRIPNGSKAIKKKCECCEGIKCSEKEDTDSDEEEARSMTQLTETKQNAEVRFGREKPFDCCDQNREGQDKRHEIQSSNGERDYLLPATDSRTISTASTYCKNDLNSGLCLRAVVERDGISWENLKEINFVSVINKALCNEIKPFKLHTDDKNPEKIASPIFNNIFKDSEEDSRGQSDHNIKEIIPEREDGTKFIHRIEESPKLDPTEFSGPASASFGVESDILALNTSYIFEKKSISEAQSFDSMTITPTKQLIRPDHHAELDSYFKSSFQRHSNMFDDTRAQLEPLSRRVHSPDYQVVHNGANEDSRFCQTDVNSLQEKTDGDSHSLPYCGSSSNSPQYHLDNYDGLDFNQGNYEKNEIDLIRDIAETVKTKDLEKEQIITDSKIHESFLKIDEKFLSPSQTSLVRGNNELTRAPQTSSMMFKKVFKEDESNSNSEAIVQTEEREDSRTLFIAKDESVIGKKSSCSKSSRQISSKDWRSLASSSRISRSSKTSETPEERETKEMQALKAYNEKTLVKYKRELDAFKIHERAQDKYRDPLRKKSPVGTCGNSFDQDFYVPSVPELEKPEKELISNIEKAYAKFTRSKPVDPVNNEALRGNCVTKEFFDIYTCNGRLKKNSRKIKVNEKTGMRKQHSKYSRLTDVTNESDVTSRSCKLIEGSQKGRDLDRTPAKENIRSQNVEVYFLERQIDDKPTTSKNVPLTTIKSFSRKDGVDPFPTVSSEILTPEGTQSSMVEGPNNPEENPCRIDDTDYQRQLRRNNVPKNVKEVVKNIDWSFQRPNSIGSNSHNERQAGTTCPGILRADITSGRQNIVHKTTENILQCIFANSENSERGFRLGESANEVYPIFNTVAVAMEEIVRSAALRGYNDEFISQPATEIEIPEIEGENSYGLTNLPSQLRRRLSSGFLRCSILPEDIRSMKKRSENEESLSITTSTAPDLEKKKLEAVRRETNPLDQDETISIEDEKASSLLSKLISSVEPRSAEINIPVLGQEDVLEQPVDTSGDLPNPEIRDLEDYSSFLFKGSKKLTVSSKCQNSERSLQIGPKTNRITSEQVKLALQNVVLQSPIQKIPITSKPQFEFDVPSCRSILDHFNTGGNELQSIVFKFFAQFPNCLGHGYLPRNFRGSEFIAELQMLTNLFALESKAGEIVNATEYSEASDEAPSSSSENSSIEQNDQSDRATTQTGTSGSTNFENVSANTSTGSRDYWEKKDREKKEESLDRKRVAKIDSDLDSRVLSSEKIDKPHHDHQRLLSNISDPESLPLTHSDLLNRVNFRRKVISSAFVQAIKQSSSFLDTTKGTEAEILVPNNEDTKVENEVSTPDYEELNELKSRCLMNAETDAEMPELWMTDDDEEITSQNALVSHRKNVFLIDVDDTMPDIVLRDFETAECAIKQMKTIFEKVFAEGEKGQEQTGKYGTSLEINSKVLSSTNLRFPVNGELQKLQNLIQTVANYVTITAGCSSGQSMTNNEVVESDMRTKDLSSRCESKNSNNLEEVPEILEKNRAKSTTDDSQAAEISAPKTASSLKYSEDPVGLKAEVNRFSSWDKVIPLSTKRQPAKKKKNSKPKKAVGASEPARRVVKVVKLVEDRNLDFFSARSVPQRGRGLSSGYLMDSDSDGNFTISRPPTPDSVESETSQSLSCDNEQSEVFLNPLKALEIFPKSDTSHSCTTSRPIETCWSSSSASPIKATSPPTKSSNLSNKIAEKSTDDLKSLKIQDSLEISCSLLLNDVEASSKKESVLSEISGGDLITQNASCDEELHVLSAESISTESDLQFMTPVDVAGIESKLKDVVRNILSHQFSGVDTLTTGMRIGSKNGSSTSVSEATRIDSSTDLQANNFRHEGGVEEPEQIRVDCHNRIRKLLSKADDISIEQLNTHYKVSDLTLTNSDAVSFEVSSRKSRVSVKHVAIGTEYNAEVFKDLVDTFEKIYSIGKETVTKQTSTIVPKNIEDKIEIEKSDTSAKNQELSLVEGNTSGAMSLQTLPLNKMVKKDTSDFAFDQNLLSERMEENPDAYKPATISYDSFDSWTSENIIEISESSCPAISISNHTCIEEFPEQVDSCLQFSVASFDAAATPGSSKSNDKPKKDTTPKKKGIPRPVKTSKERK